MKRALQLILSEDVQRIFDHFSVCYDVRILFFTPTGEQVRVGLGRPNSLYCTLMHKLYGVQACFAVDGLNREEAARKSDMVCYTCHAGLAAAVKPVYFDGNLVGFIIISQIRSEENMPEAVMRDWQKSYQPEELEAAWMGLSHVSQERIEAILDMFFILVDYIVSQRMITLRGSVVLQEALTYMESRLHENLSLPEVAGFLCKSPSALYKMFKDKLGKSFKEALVEMRLDKAEQYMTDNPGISLAEVAAKVGYRDPYYFFRLYKRYRGMPPGEFQAQCKLSRRQ